MTDRYKENIKTVRIIASKFGYALYSCDPNWRLYNSNDIQQSFSIDDDFMGRLALLFGLNWKFEQSEKDILKCIKVNQAHMDFIDNMKGEYKNQYKKLNVNHNINLKAELKIRKELQENANEIKSTE